MKKLSLVLAILLNSAALFSQEQKIQVKFSDGNEMTFSAEYAAKNDNHIVFYKIIEDRIDKKKYLLTYSVSHDKSSFYTTKIGLSNFKDNEYFALRSRNDDSDYFVNLPCKKQDCVNSTYISSADNIEGQNLPFSYLDFDSKEKAEAFIKKVMEIAAEE